MKQFDLKAYMDVTPEIEEAVRTGKPVVALESTILSHGMPYPENLSFAREVEKIIRAQGAIPATMAIIDGRLKCGLTEDELVRMCEAKGVLKVSRRDLPIVVAQKLTGATTVATTMILANMAGIHVFATGGIGGVHRRGEVTMDVSADLQELAHTPVAVVCAGAKMILDIGRTLEYLETMGVPVLGLNTDDFPAFYCRKSGFGVDYNAKTPADVAAIAKAKWGMGLEGGMLIGNPVPEEYAMDFDEMSAVIDRAMAMADEAGVKGKNITFLNPNSAIYEEPSSLLKQEVREPSIYNAIITAVATGASRMAEISAKVGEDTSICSVYIKNLITLGIIRKESPYGEKSSRRTIYSIEDNMFRFWYRFVPENNSIIARGAVDLAYKRIEPNLPRYMGHVFEDICTQYLWSLLLHGKSPVDFSEIGRWWGTDPRTKSQTEIDIMAEQDRHIALFGECKWTNEKVDLDVLETLVERSHLFHYEQNYLYLFAKTGFTKGCMEKAAVLGNVTLITYADILSELL